MKTAVARPNIYVNTTKQTNKTDKQETAGDKILRYGMKILLLPIKAKYISMKASSMYIHLNGVRFFARHGVLPQETVVGAYFTIDLKLKTDFSRAAATDELENTISYADIYHALREEMQTPSKLLENVCERIARRFFHDFPSLEEASIRLSKENPPMSRLPASRSRSVLQQELTDAGSNARQTKELLLSQNMILP